MFAAELPRETVVLADPADRERTCPVTGAPMRVMRRETLEILRVRRANYFVERYERAVYAGPGKTAPVYTPWPTDILPRQGVHASVVAQVISDRFADHLPYARQCDRFARLGLELTVARLCGWTAHTARVLEPFYRAILKTQLESGYIQYDATPVDVRDPDRKGKTREATLWAMAAPGSRLVSFRFMMNKGGDGASSGLTGYNGRLQTDGATNFGKNAEAEGVVRLACRAHARRKVNDAVLAGDKSAIPRLDAIGLLFRIEQHRREGRISDGVHARMREKHSKRIANDLFAKARAHMAGTDLRKTPLEKAFAYMLKLETPLLACLDNPDSRIDNNLVESAIRPLKIGAKNWLFIGHPDAGPTAAILYTLVENCRIAGLDPAAYIEDALVNGVEAKTHEEILGWIPQNYAKRLAAKKAAESKPAVTPATSQN